MNKKRVCILASGGIDSAVLIGEMLGQGYEVYPLYVRSGLYWEKAELFWLKRYLKALSKFRKLKPLTLADAPVRGLLGRHWSLNGSHVPPAFSPDERVYLPGRNLLLLGQAAIFSAHHGIPLIAQAILKGNPFSDATPEFRKSMERVFKTGLGVPLRIIVPYARLGKDQIVRRGAGLPLHLAFSCLKPKGLRPCGRCNKCQERQWVSTGKKGTARRGR